VDVTDVLRDRMQEPAGLQRMVTVSLGLHVLAATIVVFAPGRWIGHVADAPHKVMTISIAGGGEGPKNGGKPRPADDGAGGDAAGRAKRGGSAPCGKNARDDVPLPNAKPSGTPVPVNQARRRGPRPPRARSRVRQRDCGHRRHGQGWTRRARGRARIALESPATSAVRSTSRR
jgi:hypothetical protein